MLTPAQLAEYRDRGFLGPLTCCTASEMADIRADLETRLFDDPRGISMRHLDDRPLYDLCSRAALLDPIESILGPDLILWRGRFIIKVPGAKEIPWHQDASYHKRHLDPVINVSVWLALDDVDRDNACVMFIPGSHLEDVAHVESGDADFGLRADPTAIDAGRSEAMELTAGEFVLFNERIVHGSSANRSPRRRAGLSLRFTTPSVRISRGVQEVPILVRGVDPYGFNQLASAPAQPRA